MSKKSGEDQRVIYPCGKIVRVELRAGNARKKHGRVARILPQDTVVSDNLPLAIYRNRPASFSGVCGGTSVRTPAFLMKQSRQHKHQPVVVDE